MTEKNKALSILLAAIVAISLFPAAAFGLQAGSSPDVSTPISLSAQTASSAGVAKAKVSKKKIRSLYKSILKKAVKGKGVFKEQYSHLKASDKRFWKGGLAYAVHDVDRNGTPEIMVQAGCFAYDMCWHMFTVTGKKVKHLGKFGSGNLMSRGKTAGVYVWNQKQGHRWMYFVTILYGKVRSQGVVSDDREWSGYPEYKRYVKANHLKAAKTSPATKYKLLNAKVS